MDRILTQIKSGDGC